MLLELFRWNRREAFEQLGFRNLCVLLLAALREQICEQRLEHREPLWSHRPGEAFDRLDGDASLRRLAGRLRSRAFVALAHALQRSRNFAAQLLRPQRDGAAVLLQDPRGELGEGGEIGDEHAVFKAARVAVRTRYPPGCVAA